MININKHLITAAAVSEIEKIYGITEEKILSEKGCECLYERPYRALTPEERLLSEIFGNGEKEIQEKYRLLGNHFFIHEHNYVEYYKDDATGDLYLLQYEWLPFTDDEKILNWIYKFPLV